MRLVKLLAYSLLGYVLYELYLGMTEGAAASSTAAPAASNPMAKKRRSGAAAGSGKRVETEDADGARSNQTVGRGVVH